MSKIKRQTPNLLEASDEELTILVLKRNWEALRELFTRYEKPFFRLAYRFCGDRYMAEDLTSEILWRIYGNLANFDNTRLFKPWAYKVATNACLTFMAQNSKLKTQSRNSKIEDDEAQNNLIDTIADEKVDLVKAAGENEVSERVQKALLKLSEKYRLCLYLYYFEDLPYAEIALVMDLPINTVRTHIKRGKEKMKEDLKDLI